MEQEWDAFIRFLTTERDLSEPYQLSLPIERRQFGRILHFLRNIGDQQVPAVPNQALDDGADGTEMPPCKPEPFPPP